MNALPTRLLVATALVVSGLAAAAPVSAETRPRHLATASPHPWHVFPTEPRRAGTSVGVSPTDGDQDSVFHGTGTGFAPSSTITIRVTQPDGQEYFSTYTKSHDTDTSGDFTWAWVWDPGDEYGTYTYTATDGAGSTASTTFAITEATTPHPEAGSQLMFDAASAPSYDDMHTWLASPYRSVGVYVPVNPDDDDRHDKVQKKLTPGWVSEVGADGWTVMPIYLGAQAPARCSPYNFVHMAADPTAAKQQGIAAARYAARSVAALGISSRVPIFYDMEPYDAGCSRAVSAFLDGWTAGLHQARRLSGVYGGSASVMSDLADHLGDRGHREPDDIWVATDNGSATTRGFTHPPDGSFPRHRMNQFRLDTYRTYAGLTMRIDETAINDAVLDSPPPTPQLPTAVAATVAATTLPNRLRYRWSGSAVAASIASYDVRYRTGTPSHAPGPWRRPASLQGTTRTSSSVALSGGETWCFSVRARDTDGYLSRWSASRCTRRPLDDRALTIVTGWTRRHRAGTFAGTVTTTSVAGAVLVRPGVLARRVGVLVPGGARGTLEVSLGRHVVRIHLAGPRTTASRLVWTRAFALTRGTLRLRTIGAGPVSVDGLVVLNQQ